jgi:hypothetical protein
VFLGPFHSAGVVFELFAKSNMLAAKADVFGGYQAIIQLMTQARYAAAAVLSKDGYAAGD